MRKVEDAESGSFQIYFPHIPGPSKRKPPNTHLIFNNLYLIRVKKRLYALKFFSLSLRSWGASAVGFWVQGCQHNTRHISIFLHSHNRGIYSVSCTVWVLKCVCAVVTSAWSFSVFSGDIQCDYSAPGGRTLRSSKSAASRDIAMFGGWFVYGHKKL